MKNPNRKDITELIGLVVIVASLIFLGYRMRQTINIGLGDSELASQAIFVDEQELKNSHPNIWVKGNSNAGLSETESAIFENIISVTMDRYFFQWRALKRLEDEVTAEAWLNHFAGYLYRHPGVRRIWQEHEATLHREREILDPMGNQELRYIRSIEAKLELLDLAAEELDSG